MALNIRKAERHKAKLRLALAGPSGSGKTMSALRMARGVAGPNGKILMIDTERGSGDLYASTTAYDIITLSPPYKPSLYIEALKAGEDAGYDAIIVDSLSHAWSDEGGLLDQADKMEAGGKNRFTMWAELTPQHRQLVNALLNTSCHLIATVRSKQEYALEKDSTTGKNRVRKMGMGIVQRDGLEYEFTVFMDIDQNHYAHASKDRTGMFDNETFIIDEATGERILGWLNEGTDVPVDTGKEKSRIMFHMKRLGFTLAGTAAEQGAKIAGVVAALTEKDVKVDADLPAINKALEGFKDIEGAQAVFAQYLSEQNTGAGDVPAAAAEEETIQYPDEEVGEPAA